MSVKWQSGEEAPSTWRVANAVQRPGTRRPLLEQAPVHPKRRLRDLRRRPHTVVTQHVPAEGLRTPV